MRQTWVSQIKIYSLPFLRFHNRYTSYHIVALEQRTPHEYRRRQEAWYTEQMFNIKGRFLDNIWNTIKTIHSEVPNIYSALQRTCEVLIYFRFYKNIAWYAAHTIVSWPNHKQLLLIHIFDLTMPIRLSTHILTFIANEVGKLKTYPGYQPDEFNSFSGNHQQRAPYGMLLYDILIVYVFLSLYCCLSVGNKITTTYIAQRMIERINLLPVKRFIFSVISDKFSCLW